MSFIGSAISGIVHAVGSIFGLGGGGISDVISGISGSTIGGLLGSIGSGVESLVSKAGGGLSDMITAVGGGLKNAISTGFGGFLSTASGILNTIDSGVKDVSSIENEVISPIANLVGDINKTVNQINDQVFAPIRNIITSFQTTATTTLNAIHNDIDQGFTGILKLPQDLSNAFTSVDAQFARATQELGTANKTIVNEDLVPGLSEGIGSHITALSTMLAGPEFAPVTEPYMSDTVGLGVSVDVDKTLQDALNLINKIENYNGMFSSLFHGAWDILRVMDYIVKTAEISLEPIYQKARESNPYELLGASDITEAYRRGMINLDQWSAELGKQGIDDARKAIIYQLADFLFTARDTVTLHERQIINDDDYNLLMGQNNLSDQQAKALTELMQHPLSPADVAAGVARGYIQPQQAEDMYRAAFVPQNIRDIIPELEMALRNPAKMTAMEGRAAAAGAGFLNDSLNSEVPKNIQEQYDRSQAEEGSAQLDWLQHWDIPAARWWVVAYFRGLRTRTELEQAFTALRIPPELWDDIIETEQELPPVWLVPDIVKTGVWGADKAIPTLMQLGFSEENATVLYNYGVSARNTAAVTTANDLSKVSLSNAKSAFIDGIIDKPTYEQILIDHNYSQSAAELTVELVEYEQSVAQLKSYGDTLVKEVQLGQISKQLAESNLYNLGMSTLQVETYLQKIETAKLVNAKLPSESQLKEMYKKAIIDVNTALETMQLIGYNELWAARIMNTW